LLQTSHALGIHVGTKRRQKTQPTDCGTYYEKSRAEKIVSALIMLIAEKTALIQ